jgi:predicted transcriptional regulator
LKVGDMLTRPMITIPSGSTVLEASKLMAASNLGLLVVCDPKDKSNVLGVVSERDIIKSIAAGRQLAAHVDEIASRNVITVKAEAEVAEAAKAMNKHGIRHVVVVDDLGKAKGVVAMRDLVGERATLAAILQSHEAEVFIGGD